MALTQEQIQLKADLEQYLIDLQSDYFVKTKLITKEQLIIHTTTRIAELGSN